jgi:hypothetical protein
VQGSARQARGAAALLALLLGVLLAGVLSFDLARASAGQFWSDGATYHAMAHSLAQDGDVRYEARDVLRSRREFAGGPQGLFLKRVYGGQRLDFATGFPWWRRLPDDEQRIYFAKSLAYPLAAAPFVRLLGTHGLLVLNALALWVAVAVAYSELRRQCAPLLALSTAIVVMCGGVAPLYLVWLTPELFNLGLIAAALWAWRSGRPWLAAALLGLATYSKPPHVLAALPLCVAPLLERGRPLLARLGRSAAHGVAVLAVALAFYALNAALTGEANYQGGQERKTFYGQFPFETHGVTFGNSGIWMSTNQLGPRVQGVREQAASQGAEPPRSLEEHRASFLHNLLWFWNGRFGGLVPYYFPLVVAVLAFLLWGPRAPHAWLGLAVLSLAQLAYITQIPDNWYGGSGTLGNRYFMGVLPVVMLLVPRGREWLVATLGALGALAFVGPMWLAPVEHAQRPGQHATRAPFSALPAELSMLNDLAIFGEPWRKKQPFGDTEGDPRRPGSADPHAYYLYFTDDGTYFKELHDGRPGFWLRAGARAEVLVRALEPARSLSLTVTGGPVGDDVLASVGAARTRVVVAPGEARVAALPLGRPFPYKATAVYVLRLRSARGAAQSAGDPARAVGAFVELRLQ